MTEFVDYPLQIKGTRPADIPMLRLAQYMAEFAKLLGSNEHVFFSHIQEGSAELHACAPVECVPLISPRLRNAATGDPDSAGHSSWKKLNELLSEDRWTAELPLPNSAEIIKFPGHSRQSKAIRTVAQATSVQGRLVRIEGAGDTIHVGLDMDGNLTARISINADMGLQIAPYWHQYIRLSGDGRWKRDEDGKWVLDRLTAKSFEPLEDIPIGEALERLRKVIDPGSGKDIIASVEELRRA